ncbi:unnamed protein product [Zymoseptoria tritici ST99CH_1E4]|uniref:Uncharacterized protein n=1 Tax=Zymoseptoria tritici ST99CH_1E4 TaxID=1276532 RepID=A0A2H1FKR3_ZYMTR|nr:unnamed protein product [Zymoseptoria tritici ST99CH_1E4]
MAVVQHIQYQPPLNNEAQPPRTPLWTDFPIPRSANGGSSRHDASDVSHDPSPTMPRKQSGSSVASSKSNSRWAENAPSNPANVHPAPAYVAGFGASQVVSDAKRHFSEDEEDDVPATSTSKIGRGEMEFSAAALTLINAFLDNLLFSILSHAKSTTLTALRPAVVEVLKSRLASEAIASAEEELQELLAGGDEEETEMNMRQSKSEHSRTWDTELVWKRTRLRVMVYIRLGEMEDDDEERYVREDALFAGSDRRFSQSTGLVSWAAAIFLTSVVEYVAEQVLKAAGHAAALRARRQSRHMRTSLHPVSHPGNVTSAPGGETTVEDFDMEKVALNSTLGRLWRTWRKAARLNASSAPTITTDTSAAAAPLGSAAAVTAPTTAELTPPISPAPSLPPQTPVPNFSHRSSRELHSMEGASALVVPRASSGVTGDFVSAVEDSRRASAISAATRDTQDMSDAQTEDEDDDDDASEIPEVEDEHPEHVLASNIPLPLPENDKRDIDEIEIPGLARDPDAGPEFEQTTPRQFRKRRGSWSGGFAPLERNVVAVTDADVVNNNEETSSSRVPVAEDDARSVAYSVTNSVLAQETEMAQNSRVGQDRHLSRDSEARAQAVSRMSTHTEAATIARTEELSDPESIQHTDSTPEPKLPENTRTSQDDTIAQPTNAAREAEESEALDQDFLKTPTQAQFQPRAQPEKVQKPVKPVLQRMRSSSVPTSSRSAAMDELVLAMPGAFLPDEVEVIEDARDQQKLNADEMAVYKRRSLAAKSTSDEASLRYLYRNEVVEVPAQKLEKEDTQGESLVEPAEQEKAQKEETREELVEKSAEQVRPEKEQTQIDSPVEPAEKEKLEKESANKGIIGGAVAAASAVAAGAVALVAGTTSGEKTSDTDGSKTVKDNEQAWEALFAKVKRQDGTSRPVSPMAKNANDGEDGSKDGRIMMSRRVSMSPPPTPITLVRNQSHTPSSTHTPSGSKDSFALDDGTPMQKPIAKPRHLSTDLPDAEREGVGGIGVARTSDSAVATPRDETVVEFPVRGDSLTSRRSRIVLASDAPSLVRRESHLNEAQVSTTTPEDFLHKRALATRSQLDVQQPTPAVESVVGANGPRVQVPTEQPTPFKVSPISPNADSSSPMRKSPYVDAADGAIQKKPSMQNLSSLKKKESGPYPLTSANIKGPEDFEMFVQGGDTVKYTLTPENVRDGPSSVAAVPYPRLVKTISAAEQPEETQEDSRTGRSQKSKHATAASQVSAGDASEYSRTSKDTKRRSISRPVARNTSVHRKSGLMAREPQVVTESTRDFADWIRSTGPSKEPEIVPILASNMSTTSLLNRASTGNSSTQRSTSPGGASLRSLNRSVKRISGAPPMPPMPAERSQSRPNLQPRSAVSTSDGSAELIDFIRSGPNGTNITEENRARHISRSVAPFRTTLDSEQMNDWGDGLVPNPDRKLGDSSSSYTNGGQSSFNSKSALIGGSNANQIQHPAHSGQPQTLSSGSPPIITKKRVRNKDPYAIDFDDLMDDDDDDALLTALPTKPAKRPEESLIEFLRNTEPDVQAANRRASNSIGTPPSSPPLRNPLRKPSNQALPTLNSFNADAGTSDRRPSATPSTTAPIPARFATTTPKTGTASVPVGSTNKSRPGLEARANGSATGTGTGDLADFLRSSGPIGAKPIRATSSSAMPAGYVRAPKATPLAPAKKSGGLRVFFSGLFGGSSSSKSSMEAQAGTGLIAGRQYVA